jgi:hypothetical protein
LTQNLLANILLVNPIQGPLPVVDDSQNGVGAQSPTTFHLLLKLIGDHTTNFFKKSEKEYICTHTPGMCISDNHLGFPLMPAIFRESLKCRREKKHILLKLQQYLWNVPQHSSHLQDHKNSKF